VVRLARWWLLLLGGVLLGAGLVLHAQLACLQLARAQVERTFFLWRAIGKLTFAFQDGVTQAALWADEVPDAVVRESERGAWTLVVIGAALALSSVSLRSARSAEC